MDKQIDFRVWLVRQMSVDQLLSFTNAIMQDMTLRHLSDACFDLGIEPPKFEFADRDTGEGQP